jgi:tetratricopeptide (TPR) repeat protein
MFNSIMYWTSDTTSKNCELCFDMGIDYESLPGEGKSARARELVAYCLRNASLNQLMAALRKAGKLPIFSASGLPAPSQHFIGRAQELDSIITRLQTAQVVAVAIGIHGTGGVGKTALVQMIAHRATAFFSGGVLWLDVGPKADTFTLLDRCAAFAGADVSVYMELEARASAVRTALAGLGRLLVVLDDVWDYDGAELLLRKALPTERAVLMTSRDLDALKALRCDVVRLDVLPEDDAVKLLAGLLGELGTYENAAHQIARLVGFLPLALELVAGQCDTPEDLPDLAHRLNSRPMLNLLKMPVGEKRETSVEACLALSYNAMDAHLQQQFRALGAFASAAFDLVAVQSVWVESDRDAVAQALQRLARRGLLTREAGTEVYRQHALLRAYALALLDQTGEEQQICARHAEHYCRVAETGDWRTIEAAFDQIAHGWKAMQASGLETVIRYLYAVEGFLYLRGRWITRIEWSTTALDRARSVGDRQVEGKLLNDIGFTLRRLGQWDLALDYFRRSLLIREQTSDRVGQVVTLNNIGKIYRYKRELDTAAEYYQRALSIAEAAGDRMGEGWTLNNIGGVYQRQGRLDDALNYFGRGLAIYRQIEDKSGEAFSLNNIGEIHLSRRELDTALDHFEHSLAIRQEDGNRSGEAQSLNNIGRVHHGRGENTIALEHYQRSLAIRQDLGDRAGEARMLFHLALFFDQQGDSSRALSLLEQCLAINVQLNYPNAVIVRAELEEMRRRAASHPANGQVQRNCREHPNQLDRSEE